MAEKRRQSPSHQWYHFGSVAVTPTTFGTAVVDTDVLRATQGLRWHVRAGKHPYLRSWTDGPRGRRNTVYLHHLLMDVEEGKSIDFANGNTLDCRRENLRLADKSEDCCNRTVTRSSSGFLGVSYDKSRGKWVAQIRFRGVHKSIGRFGSIDEAVTAREKAAEELHGEFASRVNKKILELEVKNG